jgi:hypothetical protein
MIQDYQTVGHLYRGIAQLAELATDLQGMAGDIGSTSG